MENLANVDRPANIELVSWKNSIGEIVYPIQHEKGADHQDIVLAHLRKYGQIAMGQAKDLYNIHRLAAVVLRLKKAGHVIENIQKELGVNWGVYKAVLLKDPS